MDDVVDTIVSDVLRLSENRNMANSNVKPRVNVSSMSMVDIARESGWNS